MDISVLLASYKRSEILKKTLNGFGMLNLQNISWELLVVDNADDAATAEAILEFEKTLPLKFFVEPKPGKNVALNTALPYAKGKLIVFTDDDIIAKPDWLLQLWEGACRWPEHKVFGGRVVADWPAGVPFWGDDHPLNQSLFSLHWPTKDERPYGAGDFLPYGPNMAIRREIFEQGYRFNPDIGPTNSKSYRMGSETEFLKRLKEDGYLPVFLPKAEVKHQIRPDQLTAVGLNRRNFRIGLSDIDPEEKLIKKIFGCAPYLWKQLAFVQWARLKSFVSGDKLDLFENTCRSWRLRGKIYAQRQYGGAAKTSFLQKVLEAQ